MHSLHHEGAQGGCAQEVPLLDAERVPSLESVYI
jgi:hypothetical protein